MVKTKGIREATIADMAAIKKIADNVLKRHFWMSWTTQDIFRPDRKVIVYEINGRVVGFAFGSKKLDRGYLLGVKEECQKLGIGKTLAKTFREWRVIRSALPFFRSIGFGEGHPVRKSTKGSQYDTFAVRKEAR